MSDSAIQHEFTIPLSVEEYMELEHNVIGKRTRKLRYFYQYQDKGIEIDIFQDNLAGLALADMEFTDEDQLNQGKMPEFCLIDITQDKTFAGGMLVGKHYQDIETKLQEYGYKPLFL